MKQIIQNLKTGDTVLEKVPAPRSKAGHLLIQTSVSLVSAGTERMLVEFGNASLIQKARQQPEKVNQVLDKVRSDGLMPTIDAVRNKLGQPIPLGYCNVGTVVQTQSSKLKAQSLRIGDRVVSNGPHAEIVCVPKNLCAKIPASVSDDAAAFTVIGAVGLQGVRLLKPTFGETIVVIGLGLIGLIAVQILKANGCRVIGFDYDQVKVDIANSNHRLSLTEIANLHLQSLQLSWDSYMDVNSTLNDMNRDKDQDIPSAGYRRRPLPNSRRMANSIGEIGLSERWSAHVCGNVAVRQGRSSLCFAYRPLQDGIDYHR